MGKYRFVYFDAKARGDVSRMLFTLAGVEFEDQRIKEEEWPEIKNTLRFGLLPYLDVDGERIHQSRSIERFLARKFGFAGKTDIDQAKVDMIMEIMEDGIKGTIPLEKYDKRPEGEKAAIKKKVEEEEMPNFLKDLETLLKSNKGGDGYFVGDELTVTDLSVTQMLMLAKSFGVDIKIENFPKLKAHTERVEALPKIAEWIAKRPKTEY